MARWTKGSTRFSVSVAPSAQTKTRMRHIPKPVSERLGNTPGLTFVFAGTTASQCMLGTGREVPVPENGR